MPRRIVLPALLVLGLALPTGRVFGETPARCFPSIPNVVDCLTGRFDEYWKTGGGLPVFGYPITPVFDAPAGAGATLSQMVERNRLEYHPELAPPYDILLGRLGADQLVAQGRDWWSEPRGLPQAGCRYADETEHTICDQENGLGFLSFYRAYGLDLGDPGVSDRESLALWGLPLTEPAFETNAAGQTVLMQWFERARFEYHPDNPPAHRVLLGLLGREAWGSQPSPPATSQPIPPAIAPPPPPSARTPANPTDQALKQRLFDLVDALHQEAGCRPFVRDVRLDQAAQGHANDIASHRRIDHVGTDGATLRERLARVGYPYNRATESIGIYATPEATVGFWMDEPPNGPHRLNITNCQYIDVGIGLAYDSGGRKWWVMDAANQR